jgi:Ca2+-binding RTX toxin-like protein
LLALDGWKKFMTTQFDSMPVSVIGSVGGQISLLDVLKASYGDQVSSISSVSIAYRDHDFFTNEVNGSGAVVARPTSQIFSYWDPNNEHDTTVSLNGKDIGGSGANSFNLTTISYADFANTVIHSGNNIMPNIYVEVTWASANGQVTSQQELNFNSIPANLDSPELQAARAAHAGAPTAADVVLAAEHVAAVEHGVVNANDCHWIAQDIAALANAPLDPVTQNVDNPSLNQSGGFWRVQDFGSAAHPLTNWQSEVQAGDIVRMGWSSGGFHTTTVTAGLNADGKHPGMIEVVDNADTGGKIGEHWVNYQSITDPKSITIYRIGSDHMNLIDGTADNNADTILGTQGNDLIKGGNGGVTLNGGDGNDHLIGGSGNDALHGGAGNDTLDGGVGNDVLDGGAGNDVLDGWTGANVMYGGAGNDIYYVSSAYDVVSEVTYHGRGDAGGIDEVRTTLASYALPEANRINGNIENLSFVVYGSNFIGTGNSLDNVITGGYGNDTLNGEGGNDTLIGGAGNDMLDGGSGRNIAVYTGNASDYKITVYGDTATITDLRAGSPDGTDTFKNIELLKFADGIRHFSASEYPIVGTSGRDVIDERPGNDSIDGGAGIDELVLTGKQSDYKITVYGDTATITDLRAGSPDGTDTFKNIEFLKFTDGLKHFHASEYPIVGTSGRDVIDERPGNDSIDGGAGSDELVLTGKQSDYKITVDGDTSTITDLRAGSPDGTDTFKNIEYLRFTDGLTHFSSSNYVAGSVAINDVSISEGADGSKVETFTATRTGGSAAFDVNFATADGTATSADHDYDAKSGSLHFDAGVNTQTISVTVNGDTKVEGNETFNVNLSDATSGATISHAQGVGTIVNDDTAAATHHVADDFNGDGISDVLFGNSKGTLALWELNGDHIATNTTVGSAGTDWHVADVADFNGDGKADVLWENSQGQVAMWQMNGDHIASNTTVGSVGTDWHAIGAADFNGDGKADILWENSKGQVAMWQMNGDHVASNTTVGSVGTDWHAIGAADFNGDGKADVLWENSKGQVAMWQMNGDHVASNTTVGSVGTDWKAAGVADFNGDGKADVLWQNDKGQVAMWQMNGDHIAANTTVGSAPGWSVIGTGDYNHDGKADVLLQNATGTVAQWQMNGDHIAENLTVGSHSVDWHAI